MSQSAANAVGSDAPSTDGERPGSITFQLSIVSPSSEVASPLTFPRMLASTTIQELKAKIRDVVPSKPDNASQRLIHRGRMLGESQTMLQVFGQESLSTMDAHTLHLVLRPPPDNTPANTSTTNPTILRTRDNLPSSILNPTRTSPITNMIPGVQDQQQQRIQGLQQPLRHNHDIHHAEHIHNVTTQRLQQLQRETERLQQEIEAGARAYHHQLGRLMNNMGNQPPVSPSVTRNPFQPPYPNSRTSLQQLIAEQQQRRATEGRQGAQAASQPVALMDSGRPMQSFRAPDHSTTYTREGVGPNGERWQVTVNETTTTVPVQHLHQRGNLTTGDASQISANPAVDLQHMFQNVDRFMAGHNRQNNGRRSSSNPPPRRPQTPNPPTQATPEAAAVTTSNPPSAILLNPTANASAPNLGTTPSANFNASFPTTIEPMVYILTSPSGPRALLINNSESFYTPRISRNRQSNAPTQINGQPRDPVGLPEYRNRNAQRAVRRGGRHRANEDAPADFAHNQNARPAVPIVLRLFNLLWLIVRLVGFVWFFTSGNSSWSRFLMMTGLALIVFIVNTGVFTGVFNSVAEQLLGPLRRHLENLIPLAGPDAALVPAANAVVVPQNVIPEAGDRPRLRRGELDEAQVAARFIEQRRQANRGWLMTQIRRAEHAALLFIASLIPGVGERHIAARDNAAREAEAATAERERQRAEGDNAATGENSEATGESNAEQQPSSNSGNTDEAPNQGVNADIQGEMPQQEPLVAT